MNDSLSDLEKFLHTSDLPVLIVAGLAHAQFETIHPFLDGNGEGLLAFFLNGVSNSAANAAATATRIHQMREQDRQRLVDEGGQRNELALLDRLYKQPIVDSGWVERELNVAKATANKLLARMEVTGILRETTGFKRNR